MEQQIMQPESCLFVTGFKSGDMIAKRQREMFSVNQPLWCP